MGWQVINGVPHFNGVRATTDEAFNSNIDRIWRVGDEKYVEFIAHPATARYLPPVEHVTQGLTRPVALAIAAASAALGAVVAHLL